jgi:hypothetical protein
MAFYPEYFMIICVLAASFLIPGARAGAEADSPLESVTPETVREGFNGEYCWFHPRAGSIPAAGKDGQPLVVMTLQKWFVSASDYFSGLSMMWTGDGGATWQGPEEMPGLGWREEGDGITVGVCDFTPGWHPPSGKLLGLGHTVRYTDGHLMRDPRPRETAWSVFDLETKSWSPWKVIAMPEPETFFSAGAGCAQWLVDTAGRLVVPFYYKSKKTRCYTAAIMRCAFDGETVRYIEHGNGVTLDTPRGLYEPSLAYFKGKVYMTLRHDHRAYVTVSEDGLHIAEPEPWTFDDGSEIGSYNTQQHWVAHSDALYLAYTRRGADNDHIPRHRAPLFIARVDTEKRCLIRATERIAVPEKGARLGNFGVVMASPWESWITAGEGMFEPSAMEHGANGRVWASRLRWSRPNALAFSMMPAKAVR